MTALQQLQYSIRHFAEERDSDKFHSPKNLAVALLVEASEILEHFQWLTESESASLPPAKQAQVAEEIADVFIYLLRLSDKLFIYLLRLSDKLGIDPMDAANRKIEANALKYPVEKSKGRSTKYTQL